MKKSLIIGICAGAVVVVGGIVTATVLANRPEAVIYRAWNNTIDDWEKTEIYDDCHRLVNGGSISASADFEEYTGNDVSANFTVYTDLSSARGAIDINLLDGDDVLINANGCYNERYMNIASEQLLEDDVYGVNIRTLEDNYEDSVLDPDSYDDDDYSMITQYGPMIRNFARIVTNSKTLERDSDNLSAKYRKLLIGSLLDNSEIEESSESVTCGDEDIPCRVITLNVNGAGLASAYKAIVDEAIDDDELKEYLINHAMSTEEDPEDSADKYIDYLKDIRSDLNDLKDSDLDATLVFYITKSGTRIAKLDIAVNGTYSDDYVEDQFLQNNECDAELSIVFGKHINTTSEMSLEYKDNAIDDSGIYLLTIEQNDRDRLALTLSVSDCGDETRNISFDWDRDNGDFEFKSTADGETPLVVKGSAVDSDDTRTIAIDSIEGGDYGTVYVDSDLLETLNLTFTLDFKADFPSPTKHFTELTELSKHDLEDILDDVYEKIYNIMDDIDR